MKPILNIIRWILGVVLLLVSIAGFAGGDIIVATISLFIALLCLPPVAAALRKKMAKAEQQKPVMVAQTLAGINPPTNIIPMNTQTVTTIPAPKKKTGGILALFSGWGSAIKTTLLLENCIKQFPDIKQETISKLVSSKQKWGEGDSKTISQRIIGKYDLKINAENVDALGQKYLDFYLSVFPEQNGHEIKYKINVSRVEAFLFTKVNDDEALDPTEIEQVIAYSKSLNVSELDSKEKIRADYDFYITNWEIDNKVFKGLDSDFMLDKNEQCIYKLEKCELVKRKSVTRSISYGGASYRMRLGKGLSYRVGSTSISTSKETIEVSEGNGILNVTTKRILFKGKEGVVTINTNAIVDIEPFSDAVIIHKTTGKPISINTKDGITLYKYLRSAIRGKK